MTRSADDICWSVRFCETEAALGTLRSIFPKAEANQDNLVLFSTSGIHGSYATIEDIEAERAEWGGMPDEEPSLTFLVVRPRIVCLQYGTCTPRSADDFAFLKKLRKSSWAALAAIGKPHPDSSYYRK